MDPILALLACFSAFVTVSLAAFYYVTKYVHLRVLREQMLSRQVVLQTRPAITMAPPRAVERSAPTRKIGAVDLSPVSSKKLTDHEALNRLVHWAMPVLVVGVMGYVLSGCGTGGSDFPRALPPFPVTGASVVQGNIGDCGFLSVIAALAEKSPDLLFGSVKFVGDVWTIRGITTAPESNVIFSGHAYNWDTLAPNWPSAFENALRASWQRDISGAQPFQAFGFLGLNSYLTLRSDPQFDDITSQADSRATAACVVAVTNPGWIPWHCYAILAVDGAGVTLSPLRGPEHVMHVSRAEFRANVALLQQAAE